jgi:hypothetical protein
MCGTFNGRSYVSFSHMKVQMGTSNKYLPKGDIPIFEKHLMDLGEIINKN